MKRLILLLIGLLFSLSATPAPASDVDLGVSVSDGRLRSFYLAVGDYYQVPPRQVVEVRERYRFSDEELPVVYFLAARAHVEPAVIISLRVRKMSWFDIALQYQLAPEIFSIPLTAERIGPPYGKAYGYYRKPGPAGDWRNVRLTDAEVVDLVNLRFLSEHYHMTPEKVMEMRNREKRFVVINNEIRKENDKGKPETQAKTREKNAKGKNKR
jgi:hypothetical protein